MQERIMDLLVVVENEDVTAELIQVNEDLNNAILGCERWAVGSLSDRPPGLGMLSLLSACPWALRKIRNKFGHGCLPPKAGSSGPALPGVCDMAFRNERGLGSVSGIHERVSCAHMLTCEQSLDLIHQESALHTSSALRQTSGTNRALSSKWDLPQVWGGEPQGNSSEKEEDSLHKVRQWG